MSLLRWIAFLAFCMAISIAFGQEPDPAASQELDRFPVQFGGPIQIPVEVFGEKHNFLLNTGMGMSVFDTRFRDRLARAVVQGKIDVTGVPGNVEHFAAPEMRCPANGRQELPSKLGVFCMDLSHIGTEAGVDVPGFVGMDSLVHHVIRINLDQAQVTFLKAPTLLPAHIEKIRLVNGLPRILMEVSDEGFQSVEVGAGTVGNVTSLDHKLFAVLLRKKKILLRGVIPPNELQGQSEIRYGVLDSITLGPYKLHNIHVSEGNSTLIGLDFFRRFDAELDFPNRLAYFRPSSQLNSPERANCAGMGVGRIDSRTFIIWIWTAGAADQSGIAKGDLIVQVNGVPAAQLPISAIRQLLSEPGQELKLSVERDGVVRDVALKLEMFTDPFPVEAPKSRIPQIPD